MKKPTFSRIALSVSLLFLGLQSYAQNYVPFTPRFNQDLKGDTNKEGNKAPTKHQQSPNKDLTPNNNENKGNNDVIL